jgi:RNA polymerase sigma factor (sigma-70 family)
MTLVQPLLFAFGCRAPRALASVVMPAIIVPMMHDDPFPTAISDGALLVAFGNGDMRAAADLIDRLSPRVLSQATRLLGNRAEAEEIAQEAMLRLWHAAQGWRQGEAQVSTWLYRVTANLCIDRLRTRRASVAIDAVTDPADPAPSVADHLQTQARHRALSDALADLPQRQAMAVSLRFIEGLSNPDIASIMGIGVEAVESLTARGKRALTAMLAGRKDALGYDDDN